MFWEDSSRCVTLGEILFASKIGVQLFIFLFKSSKFNETRLRNQFLLLSLRINDEDVLDGVN